MKKTYNLTTLINIIGVLLGLWGICSTLGLSFWNGVIFATAVTVLLTSCIGLGLNIFSNFGTGSMTVEIKDPEETDEKSEE